MVASESPMDTRESMGRLVWLMLVDLEDVCDGENEVAIKEQDARADDDTGQAGSQVRELAHESHGKRIDLGLEAGR